MSSIVNVKIENELQKCDRKKQIDFYGKNFHENFKDFTYSNPVIRRQRVMKIAKSWLSKIGNKLVKEVVYQTSKIFTQSIENGLRLSLSELMQLKPVLKTIYIK